MINPIQAFFQRRTPITAPWLTAISAFRAGFRSISPAISVNHRSDGGCDLDFHPEIIGLTGGPFTIWLRRIPGHWQYAIAETDPDTATNAGRVYKPDGVYLDVTKVAWTTIAATTSFWLKLIIDQGSCTASFETAAPTVARDADPATLAYFLGSISFASTIPVVLQRHNAHIDLTGAIIPAWYAGYDAEHWQLLSHGVSGAPAWTALATTGSPTVQTDMGYETSTGVLQKSRAPIYLSIVNDTISIVAGEATDSTVDTATEDCA